VTSGGTTADASAPASVSGGGNSADSSTGAVQVGGGNTASGSTGAVQVSGVQAAPSGSATTGGQTAGVDAPAGSAGGGNTSTGSTGTVQVGGGDTGSTPAAATGSGGSASAAAAGLPAGAATPTTPLPVATPVSVPVAAADVPAAPHAVTHLLGQQKTLTGTPTTRRQGTSLLQRVARGATLPFTGLPLLWVLALGLLALLLGALLRRPRMAAVVLAATATLVLQVAAASAAELRLTSTEQSFLAAVNQARVQHGQPPLTLDGRLVRSARFHSRDMVDRGYFAHGDIAVRISRFGVPSGEVGENLGWSAQTDGSTELLTSMWLRSPEHRSVLLDPHFDNVGVGVAVGPFRGWPRALVVTTDFLDD
jgi:uncharacterized protein YkwD